MILGSLTGGEGAKVQQAWYRKYRPIKFSEVVGQEHIKTTLLNQIKGGKIGHAYLFAGPKGTGKTSIARILARAVNCLETSDGEPCGKCTICQSFDNGQMIDLIEIDAASHRGIENIRELINRINLAPSLGKYKVYVIDEAHMLTKEAFNALLKTLEEPPAHAIFILATTEPHKFPATIISRCQRFDFRYLSVKDIASHLANIAEQEKIKIDEDAVLFLAEQSEGSGRDGISLLEQAASMGGDITKDKIAKWLGFVDWTTVYNLTALLTKGDAKQTIRLINQLYLDGYDLTRLAEAWVRLVRQQLAVKLGNSVNVTEDQTKKLADLNTNLSIGQIVWLLEEVMTAANEIKTAVMPQVPLEILVVRAIRALRKTEDKDEPPDKGSPSSASYGSESDGSVPPLDTARGPGRGATGGGKTEPKQDAPADWPTIVQQVRGLSPTLGAMLGHATAKFEGSDLVLGFKVEFYKAAMEQTNNRQLLSEVLKKNNRSCTIKCLVDQSGMAQDGGVAVDDVARVFGEI